ncbi:MAG TPA: M20 family metallopeptidase [Candidatus Dormibacteraeota bacterium]|nr:M20 family metallopeptidase [Candidatus Dormibacteraeota bacterium]
MSVTADSTASRIQAVLAEQRTELRHVSLDIHSHPETAFEETRACATLCGLLKSQGFDVRRDVSGMATAFIADAGSGEDGPRVAFVCEYDALRGLGHACGHNLIGTASAAAGIALLRILRESGIAGQVRVVGSPAEEGGGGKIPLVEDGVFDDCDSALILHPTDRTMAVMWALACTHWRWAFTGRASHAAGDPDQGINALDAFVHAYNGVSLWRQQLKDGARVHGFIQEGGTAPNIIPERTSGEFLTRARDAAYLDEMNVRFRAIFEAAASATGCSLELVEEETYKDIRSNAVLAERGHLHLADVGLTPKETGPWERVGSSDVGDLSYACPTIHPEVAITEEGVSRHTHAFREAAATEAAHDVMLRGAAALALTGADVIVDAEIREAVRTSFAAESWRRPQWRGSGA